MAINISGILKSPQGSAIQNAEIIFEQTRTSTEVLAGTKFSVITNQTGNYSSSLGVGIYVFKVRFQDETQYRTVASNVIVTQSMNNYSLNQIIQDQSQLQDVDYDLLQDVIQARDQAAASAQAAQNSQATATTKASEASSSAQAALASKNAAQTSEANALSSKNAAQTSQTNAANSQTAAATSQTTANTKATEASNSAQAALASKNAAQTSETNALASKNQAQTSQTNAANSQTNAAASQTTASTKAGEASTSQTNAAASQTTATTKAGEASTSQTNAAASQTTATTKAGEASSSQTAAASSQSTATTKATEATNSATLAQKWAANPENSVVSGGLYSALHYAAKAAQSAQTATGQLVWRGGWSAQAGTAPPTPTGTTQDFYRITQAGTILSVQYEIGDYIHWDNINSIWFKMDGTDSVTSVNGRTGAVVVTKTDVGLSAVNNWGASSQTNDASTTTYATTAGVKAAYDLAATKLTATANAVSATKLVTPRTINGTNFDGTANIVTQAWGTSRNITLGSTTKAIDGSADVSWTLSEIGAVSLTVMGQKISGQLGYGNIGQNSARGLEYYSTAGTTVARSGLQWENTDVKNFYFGTGNAWEEGVDSWFSIRKDGVIYANAKNRVYHQGFKPTADEVGALSSTQMMGTGGSSAYYIKLADLTTNPGSDVSGVTGIISGGSNFGINVVPCFYFSASTRGYSDGTANLKMVNLVDGSPASGMELFSVLNGARTEIWLKTTSYPYEVKVSYLSGAHYNTFPANNTTTQPSGIVSRLVPTTVYHTGFKPTAADVDALSTTGGTLSGKLVVQSTGSAIELDAPSGNAAFLLSKVGGENNWYIGKGGTSDIVAFNSYKLNTNIILHSDKVTVNKDLYVGDGKVYHQGFKPTAADVGALVQGAYAADLNNLNVSGQYLLRQEVTNKPAGASGIGDQVIHQQWDANAGYQIYTEFIESRGGKMWTRNKSGGVWGVWKQVYDSVNRPSPADIGALQAGATAVAATKLATARTIGGVAFDGTANINLPGVNTAGNQSTTGNAATATKLATARTISGVAFDGSANITLTAENVGALPLTGGTVSGGVVGPYFKTTGFGGSDNGLAVGNGDGASLTTNNIRIETWYGFGIWCTQGTPGYSHSFDARTGQLYAKGNGDFNDVYIRSDKRMKSDLVQVENALAKVSKLTAYSYNKHKSITDSDVVSREVGLIAQDLRMVLPEAVKEAEDTTLTISNSAVNALLVEAIKELKGEIDQLRRLINGT